jgi:hypothetical protein
MADSMDQKIKQIADMFGVTDTENLKNLVNTLSGNDSESGNKDKEPESVPAYNENINYSSAPPARNTGSLDFMSKASEVIGMYNNYTDSRINLLYSVEPFLNNQRKQRLGSAIQLLKVISVLNTIIPPKNNPKG